MDSSPAPALCPSCSAPLPAEAAKCPSCGASLKAQVPDGFTVTTAVRWAAAMFIANSAINLIEMGLIPKVPGESSAFNSPMGMFIGMLVGYYLLAGKKGGLTWARFASIAGLLLYTGLAFANKNYVQAGLQVCYSLALINLLFGMPSTARVAASASYFVLFVVVELTAAFGLARGYYVYNALLAGPIYSAQSQPAGLMERKGYELQLPDHGWKLRSEEKAKAENADAEAWLVQPLFDGHVLAITGMLERGQEVDVEKLAIYRDGLMKESWESWAAEPAELTQDGEGRPAVLVRGLGKSKEFPEGIQYSVYSFAKGRFYAHLIGFSTPRSAGHLKADFAAMASGFRLVPRAR